MQKLIKLPEEELELIIQNTADKRKLSKAIVEKDLWVCIILKYLFQDFKYKDAIVFKGGTSLSKVYHLIERFSEDIDLALDWKILGYTDTEPYLERSASKQQKFNNSLNENTATLLRETFLPILQRDFQNLLPNKEHSFYIDDFDKQTICFTYPKKHGDSSILQVIRLEIGCLAEPIPSSKRKIQSYIEEVYPSIFDENIELLAVDSLRTFFEKITILHREANRVNGNYPTRYSRHFYDVYKMLQTDIHSSSFINLDLLKKVIDFKNKFYTCNWANYDEILQGNMKLLPNLEGQEIFSKDYESMKNMIFGEKTDFQKILKELRLYENAFNTYMKTKNKENL